jgi:hypothetical protein
MINNAPEWLINLFERLEKMDEDMRLLAAATANNDMMEIDGN